MFLSLTIFVLVQIYLVKHNITYGAQRLGCTVLCRHLIEGHSHHTERTPVSMTVTPSPWLPSPTPGSHTSPSVPVRWPLRAFPIHEPHVCGHLMGFVSLSRFPGSPTLSLHQSSIPLYSCIDSLAGVRPHVVFPVVSGWVLGITSSAIQDICEQVFV